MLARPLPPRCCGASLFCSGAAVVDVVPRLTAVYRFFPADRLFVSPEEAAGVVVDVDDFFVSFSSSSS